MADLIVLVHFGFVLFVVFGGLLVLRWPSVMWLHIPAAAWGIFIEFAGWICPLTPLENRLRRGQGETGYEGDFITHYILPILYPEGLTRSTQLILGTLAFAINGTVYAFVFWRHRRTIANDI
jgi:Protein of Unknown function (DUF2784)